MAFVALAALCAALSACHAAREDELRDEARSIFARAERTVVTVKAVVKITMSGRDYEQKIELTGTVIDPSGLTVVPASTLDPATAARSMSRGQAMKIDSAVTETQLVLADGTELEADVILKDAELDFAFLRPRGWDQKDARPLDAVLLKAGGGLPQLLDEVVTVGRYGRSANRTAWLEVAHVRALVKGPRPYAICSDVGGDTPGTVAYSAHGLPLGVFVTHVSREGSGDTFRSGRGGGTIILRAIEDVLEVADQAKKLPNPPHRAESAEPAPPPPAPALPAAPAEPAAPR